MHMYICVYIEIYIYIHSFFCGGVGTRNDNPVQTYPSICEIIEAPGPRARKGVPQECHWHLAVREYLRSL